MFIKQHIDGFANRHWYVSTDDGQYDAADPDLLAAMTAVAHHMENDLTNREPEDVERTQLPVD